MQATSSHRWKSSHAIDVDAYLLTNNSWLLFSYIKDEKIGNDLEYFKALAGRFTLGPVLAIARALKIENRSEPLGQVLIADQVNASHLSDSLWCREGWVKYRLESENVLNPGLFLDQAANRQRLVELVQHHIARSRGKFTEEDALLNLFSYTGSFSIAAVAAGARSTVSVDVSARYLDWEKTNFEANFGGLDAVSHKHIADDARDYLRRSVKRGTKFRWIVVDPPTFSRGQGKAFKIQDEMFAILEDAVKCLTPGGAILASGNDARWEGRKFFSAIDEFARVHKLMVERGECGPGFPPDHPLKSAWLFATG